MNNSRKKTEGSIYVPSQSKIWDHYQNVAPESFAGARPRIHHILRDIKHKTESAATRILNIGAGDGYFELSAKKKGWDIATLEPNNSTVKRLLESGISAFQGYIEKMPFLDDQFDMVVATEVLEHLNPTQFDHGMREVVRVMDRSGYFIGTVPYKEELLRNQAVCPECGEVFHRWGHTRSFSRKSLRESLSPFFREVIVKRMAFVDVKHRRAAGKIKSLFRYLLGRFGASISSPNIYFVARL